MSAELVEALRAGGEYLIHVKKLPLSGLIMGEGADHLEQAELKLTKLKSLCYLSAQAGVPLRLKEVLDIVEGFK